jgi:hypothetical protein
MAATRSDTRPRRRCRPAVAITLRATGDLRYLLFF